MTRAILRERVARKPHECTFCLGTIQPGDLYVTSSLPPYCSDIGNAKWWRLASHGWMARDCPRNKETPA
jgi:hypothetical protein